MSSNNNGIDTHYMSKNLCSILEDLNNFTPKRLALMFLRLAKTADKEVFNEEVFEEFEFLIKPKEEGVQQGNSVQGTLKKTDKSSKFVRFDIDSNVAELLLYSENPMLHSKRVEVLQVMVLGGSWLLAEYVVLPQSN